MGEGRVCPLPIANEHGDLKRNRVNKLINLMAIMASALLLVLYQVPCAEARYANDFFVTWGPQNVRSINNDHVWQVVLDNKTACGFASKKQYLFGSFDMNIKLVRGNSAGTVTAYYFSSETPDRDEIDFEFLGNLTGQPYILQTNVFWSGTGGREQRHYLWFDPTRAYHTYSVIWNPQQLIIAVDGVPIRIVENNEDIGIPYLDKQPMGLYASIWDGSIWATRGGADKINWKKSPFIASFGKYKLDACLQEQGPNCTDNKWWNNPPYQTLSADSQAKLQWADQYKIYDYCQDRGRYPDVPLECFRNGGSY